MNASAESLIERTEKVLKRLERLLPASSSPVDWNSAIAFCWRGLNLTERLCPISQPKTLRLENIRCIDRQKHLIARNTRQFLWGLPANNVLVYATSNRRHLLPEDLNDNQQTPIYPGDDLQCEIHPGDTFQERISLSERCGLWLSFHPFNQNQYLEIFRYWLAKLGAAPEQWEPIRLSALRLALERGSRSGRVVWQLAGDWVGWIALENAG